MDARPLAERLAQHFSPDNLTAFLRRAAPGFRPQTEPLDAFLDSAEARQRFDHAEQLGAIQWPEEASALVAAVHVRGELSSRSSKLAQYNLAKAVLKDTHHEAGLFAFYDDAGRFRLSLIAAQYAGTRRAFSDYRRYTFFVAPEEPHRTFVEQLGRADFSSLQGLLDAFSVEPVTRDFFREYHRLFEAAKASINLDWPDEQKQLYTQRFFNRLVFLAFLERKGWLRFQGRIDYLRALWEDYRARGPREPQGTFHRERLNTLFFWGLNNDRARDERDDPAFRMLRELIGEVPYLNGGLFEREADDEAFFFPDPVVEAVLEQLLYRFNFTVAESTPLDVEVAVDPEMLGKMFEETITGRHDTGSYYTPKEIVAFMAQEALFHYLKERLPQEEAAALEAFVFTQDTEGLHHPERVLQSLREVRVCDPACGSGAYLLGMLHGLLDLRDALFARHRLDSDSVYQRKLEIIQHNLYGVDLDPFAVNIARLRLWLSLIVDYEGETPPPLPNLDFKIEVGDSLTGPDPSQAASLLQGFRFQLLVEFAELKGQYLTAHSEEKQQLLQAIEEKHNTIQQWLGRTPRDTSARRDFDWAVEFAEVFLPREVIQTLRGSLVPIVNEADGQMELTPPPDPGGFDIVLTNPPYVRQELLGAYKQRLKPLYPQVYSGTADLYVYFFARAHQLLHRGGVACFIASNKWLRAGYGEKLRRHLLDSQAFHLVVDFGELPVFQSAATFPAIFLWQKLPRDGRPTTWAVVKSLEEAYAEGLRAYVARVAKVLPAKQFGPGKPRLVSRRTAALREQMERRGVALGEYVQGKIYFGIKTGYNKAFIINRVTRDRLIEKDPRSADVIQPLLRGDDVRHYELHFRERYLIFARRGIAIEEYPAVLAHLAQYRERLEPEPHDWDRTTQGKWPGRKPGHYAWYEIQDTVDYYEAFKQPKIVYPDIGKRPRFYLDTQGFFSANTTYLIPIEDWFLLGVLNSSLAFQYMKGIASVLGDEEQGGRLRFFGHHIETLPIPHSPSSAERRAIETVVQRIQKLHMTRRARVEAFLQALGLGPAASNSRNPLERPWALSEAEFLRRARRLPNPDPALYRAAHEETAELTERIAALEREIDERVAGLYGLEWPQSNR